MKKEEGKHKEKKLKAEGKQDIQSTAPTREAGSHGNILQADLGGVEASDGGGVLPDSPTAQPAAHQLKGWVPAEPSRPPSDLDAQTANPDDETSHEPSLQIWAHSCGISHACSTASRAGEAGSQTALPPAAFNNALPLQVSKHLSTYLCLMA